uniref:Uncharacterized protein n=1 Tax=Arundo donax TaxID=35708 RepID=A0A0A8Y4Q5_ARUDO
MLIAAVEERYKDAGELLLHHSHAACDGFLEAMLTGRGYIFA